MTTQVPENKKPQFAWFWPVFAALTLIVYFLGLSLPLLGPDEPRYAQVAREMFQRGDWITPTLGGHNWFEKPALLYWLQIVSYHLFGVSEFAARFGSAVFGLATVVTLWLLGRFTLDAADQRVHLGNWLALLSATSLGLFVFAHGASFDIVLTFPITASMTCFFIFDAFVQKRITVGRNRTQPREVLLLFGFYYFIGMAVLAKGLIGLVFPFGIVAFYYLICREWPRRTLVVSISWGSIVALAIALLWYLPMYQQHGYEFIDEFIIQHHFQRFTSNKYFHPQPFYFFFWVLPLMTLPWLPFFAAAIRSRIASLFNSLRSAAVPKQERSEYDSKSDKRLAAFAFAWLIVPLVFFSFSGSKLPGYILPSLPAALILTALFVKRLVDERNWRPVFFYAAALSTYAGIVIVLFLVMPRFAAADSVKGLIDAADRRGFGVEQVVCMHTVSHNAEFYAAGRLLRDSDGKLKKLLGPVEAARVASEYGPILVIVPLEYLGQLDSNSQFDSEVIGENGELAIVQIVTK